MPLVQTYTSSSQQACRDWVSGQATRGRQAVGGGAPARLKGIGAGWTKWHDS